MDLDKLHEIIKVFEASELTEIEMEEEGLKLRLKKSRPKVSVSTPVVTHVDAPPIPVVAPPPVAAAPEAVEEEEELETIDSPMVGTFYAAPAPGESAFVSPGDTVEENQTVCIVEAMKLMNEVPAKFPAVIERVLVENGEPVEFGQPLFAVRPLEVG